MKATSKLISVVLILAMCLSLFTVSAFAAPTQIITVPTDSNELNGSSQTVYEGTYASPGSVTTDNTPVVNAENSAVTAQSVPTVVTVNNEAELASAVARGGEIKLADNIVMTTPLTLVAGTVLDLNGKGLRFENANNAQGTAISGSGIVKNGSVTVFGRIEQTQNGAANKGFQSVASGVTFNGVNVSFNAPTEWAIFGAGVGLVYGSYNRDVSAWVGSQFELTESNGVFVIRDKTVAPEAPAETGTEPAAAEGEQTAAAEGESAAVEGEQNAAEGETAAAEGDQNAAEGEAAAAEGETAAVEGEQDAAEGETAAAEGEQNVAEGEAAAEDQQADVEVEGEDASAEGEDANAEGEDANAEGEPAAEGEQADENALPASNEQQAAENPADDEPADETPVNIVEEEEPVLVDEVRVTEEEEASEEGLVTLTGTDEVTGAVVVITGKNLPEGLTVVVKAAPNDSLGELKEGEEAILVLDISLVDAEGNEYEPKDDPNVGAVSVQIKHPSLGNLEEEESLAVYHVVDDVAQNVSSATQTAEDTMEFATGSFSLYGIVKTPGTTGSTLSGGEAEVHKKVITIKTTSGDIYVKGGSGMTFEISGGSAPESISIVDSASVSSGNINLFKAGYLAYGDEYTISPTPSTNQTADPFTVTILDDAVVNATAGKYAVVFWFKDTDENGDVTRVFMVQYVTIVPKVDIKALLPEDEWGDLYFNKCSYDPMEFYLTAELDELEITGPKGKVVEYHYGTDKKHITVTDLYGNTKTYNLSDMLSVSDYTTYDPVSHEFIGGKTLKLLPNLIRKLDFADYSIRIHQKNHNSTPTNEITLSDPPNPFVVSLRPGITVADGLNDYIKGKNVWIKFEACWPIDYDDNGKLCIWIGGQQISKDYYSISNDHQTLWIYRNLLDQLRSNNSYTLTARLWRLSPIDGTKETFYPASTSFNILAAGSTSYKSPKTGDNPNVALWAAVAVLSGGAVVALIPKKKKVKVSK